MPDAGAGPAIPLQRPKIRAIIWVIMTQSSPITFRQVAFTHLVPCFFLGVISLFIIQSALPGFAYKELGDNKISHVDVLLSLLNGVFVAACAVAYHLFRNHRVRNGAFLFKGISSNRKIVYSALVGAAAGTFDILFGLHNLGILILTIFVLIILVWHIKVFAREMVEMLKPNNVATWEEVGEMLRIYLNMLAGFTLINASMEVAHIMIGASQPFGFGTHNGQLFLDSLYYTVVVMTTLGFGDIVPKSWDGKLLLIFQCLASYVMFALVIGIITRGVVKIRNLPEDQ